MEMLYEITHKMQEKDDNTFDQQIKVAKTLVIKFREEISEKIKRNIEDSFDSFLSDIELINQSVHDENINLSFSTNRNTPEDVKYNNEQKKKERGELPDKEFVARRSVLTDLFEISHIRSIYHVFVAILIIFSINTILMDIVEKGSLGLEFNLLTWGLGKFPKVVSLWLCMQFSTLIIVYPGFYGWSVYRPEGKAGLFDYVGLALYVIYQSFFMVIPVVYIFENQIPPGSACIITCEQLRFMMKSHAFVRENFPKVLEYNSKDSKDHDRADLCPDFSKYLYFLFAPTLIYRDNYPRTATIRWGYVVSNFAQVLACTLYIYYIFERFCVPVFRNFNRDHVSAKLFITSVFSCMLPGALTLLLGFFAILHSWLNAFAEMLRFADRMFYKDWWNTTSFASYYRTWNIVVHDWLYTYVYKDFCRVLGPRYRSLSMALVFLISAVVHEYVIVMALGFFYPVLFFMFMGAGFGFIFVKGTGRSWNVFLWLALFMGMGVLFCVYNMEWFARQNCPENYDHFMDYVVPRSWTCNFDAMKSNTES
ncbi:sterol O-acyltransferase 1-like [Ruditapes philippinarum]|uniref:sterol O-acyltransferase 1-like n=1 Tax=Ruditapes philippinarum TaxID=129788 RepID=UPI00295A8E2D|nr:sterol O-acyltransferase 1-like [Ruditapes philippinarum]